ncbi:MAG: hypothetical protein WCJ33_02640 [Pseudomonadota bacterium]
MEKTVLELVFFNLFTDGFEEQIIEANDPGHYFNEPGANFTMQLKQPLVMGRAAGVCKTWYAQVQALRTLLLLQVVDNYLHFCMVSSALNLVDIDMYGTYPGNMQQTHVPSETRVRFAVSLGSREMYAVEAIRRTIEPVGDDVPIEFELVVQPCMHSFTNAPDASPKTYMKKEIAVNRVCWVHEDIRKPTEHVEFDNWNDATYERLYRLLEYWKKVFTYRLHLNILNCSISQFEQFLS